MIYASNSIPFAYQLSTLHPIENDALSEDHVSYSDKLRTCGVGENSLHRVNSVTVAVSL